jgi:hypothetical protein
MTDLHQVSSIIATAIYDCRKDPPGQPIDPAEAKPGKNAGRICCRLDSGLGIIGRVSNHDSLRAGNRKLT